MFITSEDIKQEFFNFTASKKTDMRFITPFPRISEGMRLLLLIALILIGAVVSIGFAYIFIVILRGSGALTDPALMNDINFVRIMQIMNQIGMFIVPALLIAILTENKPAYYLGINKAYPLHYLFTLLLIISINPLISQLMVWNESMQLPESLKSIEEWMRSMEDTSNALVEKMMSYNDFQSVLINVVMIVVLPAIGEELIFRSVLIRSFNRIFGNIHIAVWVSAIIFSAFHMQFYGFLPRMVLGLMFGYIFVLSGSIWPAIFAHFINNGTVVLVTYLSNGGVISQSPEEIGQMDSPIYLIISLLLTGYIGYRFYNTRKKTA